MIPRTLGSLSLGSLLCSGVLHGQTILFQEDFDATTGYNPDSTTALAGDNDWVDFANRLDVNFDGNEGYATAIGGTETVLTGAAGAGQGDPQIRSDFAVGLQKADVGRVELRIRLDTEGDGDFDANDTITASNFLVAWGTATYGNPGATNVANTGINLGAPTTLTPQADGWHLAVWADKGGLGGGGAATTFNALRIDPGNGPAGMSFELDSLTIYQSDLIEIDPAAAIGAEFTLRQEWEWNVDDDLDGWTTNNFDVAFPGGVSGGQLSGTGTTGDPQLNSPALNILDVTSGRHVIEIGMVGEPGDTTPKQLFWAVDDGAFSGTQAITIPSVPDDGALHLIRLNLEGLVNGRITRLRLDPSNASGIVSTVDFVRVYTEGPEIPYNPPPVVELDPADPIGAEYLLVGNWDWDTDDELDGWSTANFTVDVPSTGFTGVYASAIWGESVGNDAQLVSPLLALAPPSNGRMIIEIDFADDPFTSNGGQLFWRTTGQPFAQATSVVTPVIPSDGDPHTVRIRFEDDIDGTLAGLRIDPTNEDLILMGIGAVRIYRDTTGNDYDAWAGTQTWSYGSAGTLDNDDFDGDGVSNDNERRFGLDPTDATDLNPIQSLPDSNGTFVYLRRNPSLTGASYRVMTSTNLVDWEEDTGAIQSAIGTDLQTVTVELSAGAPSGGRLFVRIETP